MINQLQTTSLMGRMNAAGRVGQGFKTPACGLIARMSDSRKLDRNFSDYSGDFDHSANHNRSCQSAASLVWQAQATLWEAGLPADLSVRCDFDVASVKIALGQMTPGPVSPRGGCVASATAALREISSTCQSA